MGKKLIHNLGMKLLSLVLAGLMWIVIVNIDDPAKVKTFSQITVEIKNEDAINNLNKVYEVVAGNVVSITVKGKRSVVDSLKVSDFKATADLEKLSAVNAVPIELMQIDDVEQSLGKVNTLIINLEEIEQKQFQVTVVQKGIIEDGYSIGDIKVKPNLIKVSGARSQISRIDQVRVELDISNTTETIDEVLEPRVYDNNGYVINSSNMVFSYPKIRVKAELLKTKMVPLVINVTGDVAEGYEYVDIDYEPKQIMIAGKKEDLDLMKYIDIKADITGAKNNIEETLDIEDYLLENVKLATEGQTAMVTIKIEKQIVKDFIINTNEIDVRNLPIDTKFNYIESLPLTVSVKGLKANIDKLSSSNLNPYIDLVKLKKGEYDVPIHIDLGDKIQVLISPTVHIQLTDIIDSIENPVTEADEPVDTTVGE